MMVLKQKRWVWICRMQSESIPDKVRLKTSIFKKYQAFSQNWLKKYKMLWFKQIIMKPTLNTHNK